MKCQPLIIASENKNKYDKYNELFYNCGTLGNAKSDYLLCLLLFHKNKHIKKQKLNFLYIQQSSFSTFETEQRDSLTFLTLTFTEGGVGCPAPLLPTSPATFLVLQPIALHTLYLLENRERSNTYQKFQSISYRKCVVLF